MRSLTFSLRLFLIVLVAQVPVARAAENKNAGKALNEFFEAEWNYEMEQSPARASSIVS